MKLGNLEVQAGEKKTGYLQVEGCEYEIPVTVICGSRKEEQGREEKTKTALVTAGIHSAEYVGIQAAIELAGELCPEQVAGTVIVAPLINVSGFPRRTMSMVYEDGKNLNREFPGAALGTTAERFCHTVSAELFSKADYYIDLHSGDGYEELHTYAYYVGPVKPEVREISFQMARRVNAGYLVESQVTSGGAYNYASSLGIPSILLERGGRGLWSREEVSRDKEDVRRILAYLKILLEQDSAPVREQTVIKEAVYENAPEDGCWYPALRPGDRFRKGELLGVIRDYFGNERYVCKAKADGILLYQAVSLTVLKDGPMVAYGVLAL